MNFEHFFPMLDDTYVPNPTLTDQLSDQEKKMLEKRECLRCHEQCSGGCTAFGPEFCTNCRYAKIVVEGNKVRIILLEFFNWIVAKISWVTVGEEYMPLTQVL